jgi:hypothetical protein
MLCTYSATLTFGASLRNICMSMMQMASGQAVLHDRAVPLFTELQKWHWYVIKSHVYFQINFFNHLSYKQF